MNDRIRELFKRAGGKTSIHNLMSNPVQQREYNELWDDNITKFAELIVGECLTIVKSNIYGPCGEYDYSYSDTNAAADERAETIHEEIAYHFGVEQ